MSGGRRVKSSAHQASPNSKSDDSTVLEVATFDAVPQVPKPEQGLNNLDHTTSAAIKREILTPDQLRTIDCSLGDDQKMITWRQCSLAFPDVREQLQSLAAEIYGFRMVSVCQIGTLIYNNKLLDLLSTRDWTSLFERGVVPVIEHGHYPDVVRRHLLASSDPGSRQIRSLSDQLILSDIEFVFVPDQVVVTLQNFLSSNIPALSVNPGLSRVGGVPQQETVTNEYTSRRAA